MSAQIRYAYLKDHTWLFRRHWPKDVALVLGQSVLKQSLKTGDAVTARVRAAETNARFETQVAEVRAGAQKALSGSESSVVRPGWAGNPPLLPLITYGPLWSTLELLEPCPAFSD